MSAMLLRSALRARVALQTSVAPKAAAAALPLQLAQARGLATAPTGGAKKGGKRGGRGGDSDGLYDPYKLYQDEHGKPAYREFNPDLLDDMDDFEWSEPAEVMADKSWPQTSGTDMFTDLINVSAEPPAPEKLELILQEFYRRVEHKPLDQIELPQMSVAVDPAHPNQEALEIMKLSLLNNGRIAMDDKDEILAALVDEIDHLRKDQTQLFKNTE